MSMKISRLAAIVSVLLAAGCGQVTLTSLVDPFWGTGAVDNPLSEGMARGWNWEKAQCGNTTPAAVLPYGWASACAYTGAYSSGYGRVGYSSAFEPPIVTDSLRAYGFTHFQQEGVGNMGHFFNYLLFTPHVAGIDDTVGSRVAREEAHPGYYSAELVDFGARFELAAGEHAISHRYTFEEEEGFIQIEASHIGLREEYFRDRMPGHIPEKVDTAAIHPVSDSEWTGFVRAYGINLYFAVCARAKELDSFLSGDSLCLMVKGSGAQTAAGFSSSSEAEALEHARAALSAGFDNVLKNADAAWEDALGKVRAHFSDPEKERLFYSALYHSMLKPSEMPDGSYTCFATLWDMYRTALPLALSLADGRGVVEHMLSMTERLGKCPISMIMDCDDYEQHSQQASALPVFTYCDAFFRGVLTAEDYPRLKSALMSEFANAQISGRSPTHAVDLCGAYGAAAFVAEACSDHEWARQLRDSAGIWRTVYDAVTGLLTDGASYYEGNLYNYSFRPHTGMNGRVDLAGGPESFAEKLDSFFCIGHEPADWDPSHERVRRRDHFEGMNNQSDMETPYAYIWCGRPDRTAEVLDAVRRFRYAPGEGGCPGNNDSGGTSSWYVWACLGLYPLTGTPYYLLSSPSVDRAEIAFRNGKLRISVERESPSSIYPAAYVFNGRKLAGPWIGVDELERGGQLEFVLSDTPSLETFTTPQWY